MAYVDQRTGGNQRVATLTVVALIQGAAVIALINGLAVTWMKPAPVPNPQTQDVPITMPIDIPPPPPKKPDPETRTQIDNPQRPIPVPVPNPTDWLPPTPPAPDPIPTTSYDPVPQPQPTAAFTPRGAKPRNAPGTWATTSDYPARDLREGNQGVTAFLLTIGTDGKVQSCAVTQSSGSPSLDKATCDNVTRRARFESATDNQGKRTGGTYSGRIRWQIPQD